MSKKDFIRLTLQYFNSFYLFFFFWEKCSINRLLLGDSLLHENKKRKFQFYFNLGSNGQEPFVEICLLFKKMYYSTVNARLYKTCFEEYLSHGFSRYQDFSYHLHKIILTVLFWLLNDPSYELSSIEQYVDFRKTSIDLLNSYVILENFDELIG